MQSTIVIPRLAAAAFALGLGVAVMTGAGIAAATPADSGASPSASDSASASKSDSDSPGPEKSAEPSASEPSGPKADTDTPADATDIDTDVASNDDTDTQAADREDTGSPQEALPEQAPTEPIDEIPDDETPAGERVDEIETTGAPAEGVSSSDSNTGELPTTTPATVAEWSMAAQASRDLEDQGEALAAPDAVVPVVTAARASESATTLALAQADAALPAPAPARMAPPSGLAVLVDDLVANLARFLGYAPVEAGAGPFGLPPLRSLLEQIFVAIRRPLLGGMPNQAPSASPVQLHEFLSGEVVGDLLPFDFNGDPMTYHLTQGPVHGEVILNSNGTYVYIPERDFATRGGTDTFTVTIDDNRLLPGQTATGRTVVPVTVTLAPAPGRWRGYHIDNLTTSNATITNITGDTGDYSGPGKGHVIAPGTRMNFEADEYAFVYTDVHIFLKTADGATYTVTAHVPPHVAEKPMVQCSTSGGACEPTTAFPTIGQRAALLEAVPRTILKDAAVEADTQQIADLLKTYCADGKVASCSFVTTRQDDKALGARHQVGNALLNPGPVAQSTQISVTDTQSETDSVNVSAKLSGGVLTQLASIINVEITVAYGHQWTNTHTFTQSVTMTVPANSMGTIYARQPVYRAWGDFTVKVGNTTYILKNVYFDTPRTDGRDPGGTYETVIKPLTLQALAELPPGTTIVVLGTATAPILDD